MRKKALLAYGVLLLIVFLSHLFALRLPAYLIPVYLVAVPLALGRRIKMVLSARQVLLSLIVSAGILLPFVYFFLQGKRFELLGPAALAVQLLGVSFPEEFFFRGFLQETFGNNFKGILLTSLLFAVAHLPGLFFARDYYAPLTFFPSLVMGFLYLRTSSIIPPTIFHFLANVVYLGSL